MRIQPQKYWYDILWPILRQDDPPTVPQGVVLQHQCVLLVQRDNPLLWEFPGGGMMPGETPEETVIREVREETGVGVDIVELLGWYERTGWRAHRSPVYVCCPNHSTLRPQVDETVQVRYFPLHALPPGLFPWYRPILEHDLLSVAPRPLQRTQHLGLWTVLHCLALDVAGRFGWLD